MKFTSNEFRLMATTVQDDLYRRCGVLSDVDFKDFITLYYSEKSKLLSELYQMFVLEDTIELTQNDMVDIIYKLCDRYNNKCYRKGVTSVKISVYTLINAYLRDIADYILY